MNRDNNYRASHALPDYGNRYDRNYSVGYYSALHREVEVPLLTELFSDLSGERHSLLDFACGTGRITSIAMAHFERVVGVDVSEPMLGLARIHVPGCELIRQDITIEPLDEQFDVVTAFRFFLNAEDELRRDTLFAIRRHLRPGGHLICNVHMNRTSPMGLFYAGIEKVRGRALHNTLSLARFKYLLEQAGFSVERTIWYGVVPRPGPLFPGLVERLVGPVERLFARMGLVGRFSQSFLVVARVAD